MTRLNNFASLTLILSGFILIFSSESLAQSVTLKNSGPVRASYNGQVIENLKIVSNESDSHGCAIRVEGFKDVKIRNVDIRHKQMGICITRADGTSITNAKVVSTSAPTTGPHCKFGISNCNSDGSKRVSEANHRLNISVTHSDNVKIDNVYVEKGSGGVLFRGSENGHVKNIQCFDARGPRPRGNCVFFGQYSHGGLLENFYAKNIKDVSHDLDIINAHDSDRVTVRNGLIDGAYSKHGVGVIADAGADYMSVSDVDFMRTGTAAFGIFTGKDENGNYHELGHHFTATNMRVRDTSCIGRDNAVPSSGGLVYGADPRVNHLYVSNVTYYNHCNNYPLHCQGTPCRKGKPFEIKNIKEAKFTPRSPFIAKFPWNSGSPGGGGDDGGNPEKLPFISNLRDGATIDLTQTFKVDFGDTAVSKWKIIAILQPVTSRRVWDSGELSPSTKSFTVKNFPQRSDLKVVLSYLDKSNKWKTVHYKFRVKSVDKVGNPSSGNVSVRASGTDGSENISLYLDNRKVASWTLTTSLKDYVFEGSLRGVTRVEVRFTNDNRERAVRVDRIIADGRTMQSEDLTTYSQGFWTKADGCSKGFTRSEWLHCGGFFRYELTGGIKPPPPTPTNPDPPSSNCGPSDYKSFELKFLKYSSKSGELIWNYDRSRYKGFEVRANGKSVRTLDASSFYTSDIKKYLSGVSDIGKVDFRVSKIKKDGTKSSPYKPNCQ